MDGGLKGERTLRKKIKHKKLADRIILVDKSAEKWRRIKDRRK